MEIGNDAIQEMSLLSGTFNAEYGNALSGVVNIVTRDGRIILLVNLKQEQVNLVLTDILICMSQELMVVLADLSLHTKLTFFFPLKWIIVEAICHMVTISLVHFF